MATRFYFDSVTVPNRSGFTNPSASSSWTGANDHSNQSEVRALITAHASSALTNVVRTYDAVDHLVAGNALNRIYVSAPLTAQSIPAQTVSLQIQGAEQRSADDQFLTWKLFLIDATGAAVASGTIVPLRVDGLEFTTTVTSRSDSLTSTAVTAPLNSRLCLEIGCSGTAGVAVQVNGHNSQLRFGDNGAGDLPVDDVSTSTTLNPWLDFATTAIAFVPPAVPILRVTQDTLEGLYDDGTTGVGTLRVTQDTVEGLHAEGPGTSGSLRVTQDTIEGLYDETPILIPRLFVTQDTIEGLWDAGEPVPPSAQPESCPDGQIYTARALAGQVRYAHSEEGQISTARAQGGQVNCG